MLGPKYIPCSYMEPLGNNGIKRNYCVKLRLIWGWTVHMNSVPTNGCEPQLGVRVRVHSTS